MHRRTVVAGLASALVAGVAGCTTTATEPLPTERPTERTETDVSAPVAIRIRYPWAWALSVSTDGETWSRQGVGETVVPVGNAGEHVAVVAQRRRESEESLTVEVLVEGDVVASETVDAETNAQLSVTVA